MLGVFFLMEKGFKREGAARPKYILVMWADGGGRTVHAELRRAQRMREYWKGKPVNLCCFRELHTR